MKPDGWYDVIDPRDEAGVYTISAKIVDGKLASLLDTEYDGVDGKPVDLLSCPYINEDGMNFIMGQLNED